MGFFFSSQIVYGTARVTVWLLTSLPAVAETVTV